MPSSTKRKRCELLFVVANAWLLAAVSAAAAAAGGGDGADAPQPSPTREITEFASVKRRHSPLRSLDDWEELGFAYPDRRGAEFEALRVDKVESQNAIPRLHVKDVTPEQFRNKWEVLHEPLVIEGVPETDKWEAADWTIPLLVEKFPAMKVRVGSDDNGQNILMTMEDFGRYSRTQKDDAPLYVFDWQVYNDEVGKDAMTQYRVPSIFEEDLFQLVKGHPSYPSYRWLLAGPKRSGSNVHNDPLGTSAWNTLLTGRKLWFFAPPYLEDVIEATKDTVVTRWFVERLPKLRAQYGDEITTYVQHPGETMFVPAFWMHAVLNLDDAVAVTQNFVSKHTFPEAWHYTRDYKPRFARTWRQELEVHHKDLALIARRMDEARQEQTDRQKLKKQERQASNAGDDDDADYFYYDGDDVEDAMGEL